MRILIITLLIIAFCLQVPAQKKAGAITGTWLNLTGEAQINIYKKQGKYFGKIIWLKTPDDKAGKPLTDRNNIDPKLKSRLLLGVELLKNLSSADGRTFEDGTIYDPKSGKIYSCEMTLSQNTLKVSGYLGMFVGRTEIWKRVK